MTFETDDKSNPDFIRVDYHFVYNLSEFMAKSLKEMTGKNHMTLDLGGDEQEIAGCLMFAPTVLSPVVLLATNAIAYSTGREIVIDLTGLVAGDNSKPFHVHHSSELDEADLECLPYEFEEYLRGTLTLLLPIIEKGDGLKNLADALKPVMESTSTFDTPQFYDGLLGAIFKQREAIQIKANEALICPYGG